VTSGRKGRWSAAGLAALAAGVGVVVGAGLALLARSLGASSWLAAALAAAIGLPLILGLTARMFAPLGNVLRALEDGVDGLREGDFSLRLGIERGDEIGDLVRVYNSLGEQMGQERRDLRQRELMLASVLEATPTAVLLVNPVGRILVANMAARSLLAAGGRLEGGSLSAALDGCAPDLARELSISSAGESLVNLPAEDGQETLQVTRRVYHLNSRRHTLLLVRRMTPELRLHEAAVWKRVIRVVGHEINNSLAPIRSLIASGRKLLDGGDPAGRLPDILDTIDASARRLHRFVDGYRRMARLPAARPELLEIGAFLEDLRRLDAFEIVGNHETIEATLDPSQIQQVVLNLVRNGKEAGSETVEVAVSTEESELVLEVRDRGAGMDGDAMAQALVPFWTTKPEGSGLGLALCREILEGHGGSLRLRSREGGGLVATCRLPLAPDKKVGSRGRSHEGGV
jgi:two-component system nitrogen regulation sensor histidine kinase NtrY